MREKEKSVILRHSRLIPLIITILVIGTGVLLFFMLRPHFDEIGSIFSSTESLRAFVQQFGLWAPAIFFLIQVAQIIFSPIPGGVTTLAGGAIFGVGLGFLLSGSGTIIGSLVAFYLARRLGKNFVTRLIGQKPFEKYDSFFTGKYVLSLLLLFLLPFFPDDVLCLLAGLSSLPLIVFLLLLIVGRLPGIFLTTLVGAGIIAFSFGEWVLLGIVSLAVLTIFFKYGDRFEEWLRRKIKR